MPHNNILSVFIPSDITIFLWYTADLVIVTSASVSNPVIFGVKGKTKYKDNDYFM